MARADKAFEESRIAAASQRYMAASHAMQSGVNFEMAKETGPTSPKHLRVGVNSAMVNHAAIMTLLLRKGIVSTVEYSEALADAMEAEKRRYEEHLSQLYGKPVSLA